MAAVTQGKIRNVALLTIRCRLARRCLRSRSPHAFLKLDLETPGVATNPVARFKNLRLAAEAPELELDAGCETHENRVKIIE